MKTSTDEFIDTYKYVINKKRIAQRVFPTNIGKFAEKHLKLEIIRLKEEIPEYYWASGLSEEKIDSPI